MVTAPNKANTQLRSTQMRKEKNLFKDIEVPSSILSQLGAKEKSQKFLGRGTEPRRSLEWLQRYSREHRASTLVHQLLQDEYLIRKPKLKEEKGAEERSALSTETQQTHRLHIIWEQEERFF